MGGWVVGWVGLCVCVCVFVCMSVACQAPFTAHPGGFAAKSCPAEDCAEGFCLPNAAVDELSFQAPCGFVDDWAGAPAAGRAFIPAANALVHGTTWDGYKRPYA